MVWQTRNAMNGERCAFGHWVKAGELLIWMDDVELCEGHAAERGYRHLTRSR